MTYWYCLICGSTAPAVAGQPQPSSCQGHDKSNASTPGLRWELHEKCRFCDTNYLAGADRCPKCNNPTGLSPHQTDSEKKSSGCLSFIEDGCLIGLFGCFSTIALPVIALAIAIGIWSLTQ